LGRRLEWREVETLLRARGHDVTRPTLTGVGERAHLFSPSVDLDTHVAARARSGGWTMREIDAQHDAQVGDPVGLAELLSAAAS